MAVHRMLRPLMAELVVRELPLEREALKDISPKMFQKRRVSSAPAEQMEEPSGEAARWSTRAVWPVSSFTLAMLGYFHRHSWFWEKPCDDKISFSCGFHSSEQTWEPVSMELSIAPVVVFQNLMQRSAVPPPEARVWACHGHQARALTAARCSVRRWRGAVTAPDRDESQMQRVLSLLPEASAVPSGDHFKPHTSCSWPEEMGKQGEGKKRERLGRVREGKGREGEAKGVGRECPHTRECSNMVVTDTNIMMEDVGVAGSRGKDVLVPVEGADTRGMATHVAHLLELAGVPQLNLSVVGANSEVVSASFLDPRNGADKVLLRLGVHQLLDGATGGVGRQGATVSGSRGLHASVF